MAGGARFATHAAWLVDIPGPEGALAAAATEATARRAITATARRDIMLRVSLAAEPKRARASLPGGGVSHPRSTGSATSDPRAMRGALAAMIRATASCHPTHGDPARDRRTGWPAPAATRLHRAASAAPTRSSRGHLRGVAAVR